MPTIPLIIFIHAAIFTFAFGLAWFLPLIAVREDHDVSPTKRERDWVIAWADVLLIIMDCFPVFWLFRAIPEVPSTYTAAREKWRKEAGIRWCFYASLVSVSIAVVSGWVVFSS